MTLTRPARTRAAVRLEPVPAHWFDRLVALHRAVFPPEQVAATIYAGAGVEHYLASLAAYPSLQPEHRFWGAWQVEELVGYAHGRALPDAWHLNNIAVLPACQGQGVGRRLWQQFIADGRRRGYRQFSLHVESDNQAAIAWYRALGLEVTGAVWRYEKALPAAPAEPVRSLRLAGWDQAVAWQAAYGFSQFQIHWQDQVWTIGRIGDNTFRSVGLLPAAVETALAHIDPHRRLLIFSTEPLHEPEIALVGQALRMSGEAA